MRAYDAMGKLKWKEELDSCIITIRHRGSENNEKEISGSSVSEVKKSYFVYKSPDETIIPMHRILRIELKGRCLWKKGT